MFNLQVISPLYGGRRADPTELVSRLLTLPAPFSGPIGWGDLPPTDAPPVFEALVPAILDVTP